MRRNGHQADRGPRGNSSPGSENRVDEQVRTAVCSRSVPGDETVDGDSSQPTDDGSRSCARVVGVLPTAAQRFGQGLDPSRDGGARELAVLVRPRQRQRHDLQQYPYPRLLRTSLAQLIPDRVCKASDVTAVVADERLDIWTCQFEDPFDQNVFGAEVVDQHAIARAQCSSHGPQGCTGQPMRREVQQTFLDEFDSACFIDGTRHPLNVAVASLMLARMSQRPRPESAAQPLVCVMHLTALPSWLSMSRVQRQSFVADHVEPLLRRHPGVSVRWIDVEAFSSDCSDVLLADAADLRSWNTFVEALRDTEVFARPLFRLERLNVGIEDGYLEYDRSMSASRG